MSAATPLALDDDEERLAIQAEARDVNSLELTRFERWNAPSGRRFASTWPDVFAEAREHATSPHDGRGWSLATFSDDYREKVRVESVYALSLDLEPATKEGPDPSRCGDPRRAAEAFADFFGLVTTTRGHRPDAPRCRVLLPFDRPATADEYELAWPFGALVASRYGLRADPSTRDASRFWFLPSRPLAGGDAVVLPLAGRRLVVDELVEDAFERAEAADRARTAPRPFLGRYGSADDLEARVRRAVAYIDKLEPAVAGAGGHRATWLAALVLVRGFEIPPDVALEVLHHFNSTKCQPPWREKDLVHKIDSATRQASASPGYLLDRRQA